MLLYVIESDIPLLTFLLVWAGSLAVKGNIQKHKKIAVIHAIATWISCVIVVTLVRLGFEIGGEAPKWIINMHLLIIYTIPVTLVGLMVTGPMGRRAIHRRLALFYVVSWSAALLTGFTIFLLAKKLI